MVNHKKAVLVLGNKDEELTRKRVELAERKVKNSEEFKVIFSGTKEEIGWMNKYSSLNAIPEDKSTTTPENLINSKNLIGEIKEVWIVTDESHAFRTKYLAGKILKGKIVEVLGVEMPFIFMLKQIYYEVPRLIKHVFKFG